MLIKYDDLSRVIDRINILAKDDNKQTNLMMTLKDDDKLEISFCSGRSNLFQTIDVSEVITEPVYADDEGTKLVADVDVKTPMVMNYHKVQEVMTLFKATESIKSSDITMCQTVKDGVAIPNSIDMFCEKSIEVNGEGENEVIAQKVADLKESIRWDDPNSSMKLKIYTRYLSSDALVPEEQEDNEQVYDTWDAAELKDILGKIAAEKGRQTLISSARKIGFVYNPTNSILISIRKDDDFKNTVIFDSTSCSQVISMLGKMTGNIKLYVDEENHVCKINSEDDSVLLSITIPDANPTYIKSLNTYQNLKVNDVQCTMLRAVFKDTMKAIASITNSAGKAEAAAEATIRCLPVVDPDDTDRILTHNVVRNGNEVEAQNYSSQLIFDNVKSASGSTSNRMAIELPTVRVADGELGVDIKNETIEYKVKFSFATLLKVLENLKSDIIALDVKYENPEKTNMTIRLSEVDLAAKAVADDKLVEQIRKDNDLPEDSAVNLSEHLTNSEIMDGRTETLGVMGFIQVKL